MSIRQTASGLDLTDQALARRFGQETFRRGRAYANQGRVGALSVGGGEGRWVLSAPVAGTRTYQTVISHAGGHGAARVTTQCSCPLGGDCKHAVAVLLTLRSETPATPPRPTPGTATPAWQRALSGIAAEAGAVPSGAPLALQFSVSRDGRLDLQPLMRGVSGRWIRTGISWDSVGGRAGLFRTQHVNALRALDRSAGTARYVGYYGRDTALSLDTALPSVWTALRDALDAGVEFVSGAGTPPVRLAEGPASLVMDVEPEASGPPTTGLALVPRFVVPGARSGDAVRLVGSPAHGVSATVASQLLLTGFERPLTETQMALLRQGRLVVPHEDVARFVAGYLPALRRVVEVRVAEGLDLPEAAPPVVDVQVTFHPGHRASLRWSLRYGEGRDRVTLGVLPQAGDPLLRDLDAERTLFASLPPGPWPSLETAYGRRPAGEAILAGRATIELVTNDLPRLQATDGVVVTVHGEVPDYRESPEAPQVRLSVREPEDRSTDWFNLSVDVSLGDETVPFVDLFTALALGHDHLVLGSGTWFSLERPELDQLRKLIEEARELGEGEPGAYRLRVEHAGLWDELVTLGVVAEQADSWRKAVTGLLDLTELPDAPLPTGLRATLRPYQEEGFRWLSFLWASRLGGILADDMGLGKTLQALATVAAAHERGELADPVLVVAPTSVVSTWVSEAARFAPGLEVRAVTRTSAKRGATLEEVAGGAQIVVTSYTLLRLDEDEYVGQRWSAVFLDEAQFVKNRQSRAYRAVRRLRAGVRIAITGTPLENNLMDLWSLLSIAAPGLYPDPERFTELYRRPIENRSDPDALPRLRRRIRPLMLRRTKQAVAAELPPKQEQVVPVTLSTTHRRLYDRQLQAERQKVLGLVGDLNRNRIAILRSLTLLRQLSLSPALVDPKHPAQSAKIDLLVDMLTELAAEGHRVLVFSQFTSFLTLVKARLDAAGLSYQYLDGRTRDRAARVEAFRSGDDPAFLISLKAGGFGLTLTEADYVFVLDPWWNPAAELQAIDRTHRIGQDKHVTVYRLVSADTIEEGVVALQQRKRDLFDQVVGADADLAAPLSAADIRGLLDL